MTDSGVKVADEDRERGLDSRTRILADGRNHRIGVALEVGC